MRAPTNAGLATFTYEEQPAETGRGTAPRALDVLFTHKDSPARSYHTGRVYALMMDGSVHFITDAIPQATWRALGTRNGGEPVDTSSF
jgi:hypothetical protein